MFTGATAVRGLFSDYEWPVVLDSLNCHGNESTVWSCPYNVSSQESVCTTQYQDASVFCLRELKISLKKLFYFCMFIIML